MSQITLQEKQQALMHVAASRVAVLDSVTAVKERASGCVRALPVSPAVLMRVGAVAGAAASVAGTLAGLRSRKARAEKKAASMAGGSTWSAIFRLVLPMLLPYLQKILQQRGGAGDGKRMNF